jgi:hypothetical protein
VERIAYLEREGEREREREGERERGRTYVRKIEWLTA